MCCGLLSVGPLLPAAGAHECTGKVQGVRPIPSTVTQRTDCLMECTGMTYINKMQLQDQRNIRFQDSTEGDLGEYCWSTDIKCNVGERFEHAFVVVPVDASAAGPLEVRSTSPPTPTTTTTTAALQQHSFPSTIADNCGLRYDVTQHFSSGSSGTSFCVQVVNQQDALGDSVLKCPPFLASFWQRSPNQGSGG